VSSRSDNPEARMSIREHLLELRKRLILSLIGIALGTVGGWFLYDPIMAFIQQPLAAMDGSQMHINFQTIGAAFDLKMKVAIWAGVIITCPWWIYQIGAFIAPGLKHRERVYVVAFGSVGVILFAAGAFSGVWIAPHAVEILQSFVPADGVSLLLAGNYVDFYLNLVIAFGLSFLAPEILVALDFAGVITSKQMLHAWRWAVIAAFTFAAIANPLPSPWPMIVQAGTLLALYFLAVLVSWINERYRRYGRRLRPVKKRPVSEQPVATGQVTAAATQAELAAAQPGSLAGTAPSGEVEAAPEIPREHIRQEGENDEPSQG
jgi:Sec-independent protein translocase TatC